MIIQHGGPKIFAVLPNIIGKKMTQVFSLTRPIVTFTWDDIIVHTNNIFELASIDRVSAKAVYARLQTAPSSGGDELQDNIPKTEDPTITRSKEKQPDHISNDTRSHVIDNMIADTHDEDEGDLRPRRLFLRGQMKYIETWNCMVYLCAPLMPNLEAMFRTGIFINDLSLHDSSRALALVGSQQSAQLKLALDQEQMKSAKLEESMQQLDDEMKKTDSLLYQMIPKQVADRLRRGEPAMNTCEVFQDVSILFSDVVGFTQICSAITPMAVVSMLNTIYSKFDELIEKNKVYKVETIGDAYMVVSGAPTKSKYHALHIADMAIDMVDCMLGLKDPSGQSMKIRIGIHSGMVVAGVVGIKMPRYCLFGDTVNTASRMESSGEAMKIHISQTTKDYLKDAPYLIIERGMREVKSKGEMKTYWLQKKFERPKPHQNARSVAKMTEVCPEIKGGTLLSPNSDGEPVRRLSREDLEVYQKDFPMSAVRYTTHFLNSERHGDDMATVNGRGQQKLPTQNGYTSEGETAGDGIENSVQQNVGRTFCDLDYYLTPTISKAACPEQGQFDEDRSVVSDRHKGVASDEFVELHTDKDGNTVVTSTTDGIDLHSPEEDGHSRSKSVNDVEGDQDNTTDTGRVVTESHEGTRSSTSQSVTCGLI
ncbi:soluble guanylate cyclase 88E-like [Ptychodera flava]|uniref:soluble guanylate cyclase 88E-like n=1 Tax=Ptychodera flava TaxID=63121 RepID=UPI00396A6047